MTNVEKILALRAKAESTPFPGEAELCRAKAQELQEKYGVTDEMLAPPPAPEPPPAPAPSTVPGRYVVINGVPYFVPHGAVILQGGWVRLTISFG